jgi:hypothetical protein
MLDRKYFDWLSGGRPVFLSTVPNPGMETVGYVRDRLAHTPEEAEAFLAAHSGKPTQAVYAAMCRLRNGETSRSADTVEIAFCIWADVDFKDHPDVDPNDIIKRLQENPLQPTWLNHTGHGVQPFWQLKEELDLTDPDNSALLLRLLNLAAKYTGGDPQVCDIARMMRVPGSKNTKTEPHLDCTTILDTGKAYDVSDLLEFFEELHPLLPAPSARANGPTRTDIPSGNFCSSGERVDVEAMLAAMTYQGVGGTSVNDTLKRVIPSLLNRAIHPDLVVQQVVDAVMAMADRMGLDWDREAEVKAATARTRSAITNLLERDYHPATGEIPAWLAPEFHEDWARVLTEGGTPYLSRNRYWYVGARPHSKSKAASSAERQHGLPAADTEQPKPDDSDRGPLPGSPTGARVILRPFKPVDIASFPPRAWLYGKHYQRRAVTGTVAPGGWGKTSLIMVEAVSLATARALLGEQPTERCRVWLHNGEDNLPELTRRVLAICVHYGIPQEELDGWLFLTSGAEMPLKVAHGYNELKFDAALIDEMTQRILELEIDVVQLDPLITLNNSAEQDNGRMDATVRLFTRMSDVCDCAIDLSHHTRKPPANGGGYDLTADDSRGPSAFRDAVRAMRVLNHMSTSDARNLGIDTDFERLSYFRVDRGKANMLAPAETATWRKFENVQLANGDAVGVVTPWTCPAQGEAPSAARTAADKREEEVFLATLDRLGRTGRHVSNKGPRPAPVEFASEPEAKAAKLGKVQLEAAMSRLFAAEVIRLEEYGPPSHPRHRIVRVITTSSEGQPDA